ncbi:hypothetical protein RB653_007869 [Dictyostelium firmibasis]|uniref:serine--tRNA ligase n=1 Tax=Dictyostelium firmibasis TaxID=79012 RepID=A0AAN7YY62_9MYCE
MLKLFKNINNGCNNNNKINLNLFKYYTNKVQQQQSQKNIELNQQEQQQQQQPHIINQIKPRIDFQFIKDNENLIKDNIIKRKSSVELDKLIKNYDEYRIIKKELDSFRAKRNEIASKMKSMIKGKTNEKERLDLVEQGKQIKEELIVLEDKHDYYFNEITSEALKIPNNTHPSVPIGEESNATIIKMVGDKPNYLKPNELIKDHLELGESLGVIKSASKTTGHKYYYFTREGAMLEMALSYWAFSKLTYKYGFQSVITPDLIHPNLAEACGFQARSDADQLFWIKDRDLCLSATSEIPLAGMYSNEEPLNSNELPIKMVGYSHCFRPEVGRGLQNKGIYRVHQFSKVEMFIISKPNQSNQLLEDLLNIQIELFSELGLHFRVLDMPSEDLGAPAYRKYDIEVWIPSKQEYGEISSTSNCTDYQSKRLNIKYQPNKDEPINQHENNFNIIPSSSSSSSSSSSDSINSPPLFTHTLNGTACAIPRLILAILENNQQSDGSVLIPKVLQPFMNNQKVILPLNKK